MSPEDQDRDLLVEKLKGAFIFWAVFVSALLILYATGVAVICLIEALLDLMRA